MKIKHVASMTNDECMELFLPLKSVCLAGYGNAERQDAAVQGAYISFCTAVNEKVNEAFTLGYKVGNANANVKDDTMYGA